MNIKKDRTGEINYNKYGSKMEIIKYNGALDVTVKFDNGYTTVTTYQSFKHGEISNPYNKSIFNIGYLGEGKYIASINGKHTIQYDYWNSMLERCYNKKYHEKYPTYIGCTVYEEWLNFQNFGQWFDKNFYEVEGQRMHLDKDILHKGNKIYSPDNCIFVPENINTLFIKNDANRGKFPIGVYYKKEFKKYVSQCNIKENGKSKRVHLGYFKEPQQAYESYKTFKENYIKQVADQYKYKIPVKLYKAMYNWEVEIND